MSGWHTCPDGERVWSSILESLGGVDKLTDVLPECRCELCKKALWLGNHAKLRHVVSGYAWDCWVCEWLARYELFVHEGEERMRVREKLVLMVSASEVRRIKRMRENELL